MAQAIFSVLKKIFALFLVKVSNVQWHLVTRLVKALKDFFMFATTT